MFTEDVLRNAVEQGAADIFLIPGMPLSWKVGGKIIYQSDEKTFPKEIEEMVCEIYALANYPCDHIRPAGFPQSEHPSGGDRYFPYDEGLCSGNGTCGKR